MLKELKEFIEADGGCYAECGGLMLLVDSLRLLNGDEYPMAEVIPGTVSMTSRLQHFGYSEAKPTNHQESWRGHELVEDQRWVRVWPDRCIDAFDHALAHAARAGLEWWQADRSRFPLSAVAEDIAE